MKDCLLLDFHSHVLPGIDDGSHSVEESLRMLEMLKSQGISTVVATPHFDADTTSLDGFLSHRERAFRELSGSVAEDMPTIKIGAEVLYYPGISRLERLGDLCIEETRLLLLEMPMGKWDKYVVDELVSLSSSRRIIPVVAHVERCLPYQERRFLEEMSSSDVLFQINASFVINISTRRKALRLLKNGLVQLLGSDCHGAETRPPEIGEAYRIIADKLGENFVTDMLEYGNSIVGF